MVATSARRLRPAANCRNKSHGYLEVTVSNKQIERVVVRGTNWVGDAVMTIPALRLLRRILPAAHITLATRSFARAILMTPVLLTR